MDDPYNLANFSMEYDHGRKVMKIEGGNPDILQGMIVDLMKEGQIPEDVRAIWFLGDSPKLITGDSLVLYLMGEDKEEEKPPSFMDILRKQRKS